MSITDPEHEGRHKLSILVGQATLVADEGRSFDMLDVAVMGMSMAPHSYCGREEGCEVACIGALQTALIVVLRRRPLDGRCVVCDNNEPPTFGFCTGDFFFDVGHGLAVL